MRCENVEIKTQLFAFDQLGRELVQSVKDSGRLYVSTQSGSAASKKKAQKYVAGILAQAKKVYTEMWTMVWSLPVEIRNCPDTVICTRGDLTVQVSTAKSRAQSIASYADKILKKVSSRSGKNFIARKKKLAAQKVARLQNIDKVLATLPKINNVCK